MDSFVYDHDAKLFIYFSAQFAQAPELYATGRLREHEGLIVSARRGIVPLELRVQWSDRLAKTEENFFIDDLQVAGHLLADLEIYGIHPSEISVLSKAVARQPITAYVFHDPEGKELSELIGISKPR